MIKRVALIINHKSKNYKYCTVYSTVYLSFQYTYVSSMESVYPIFYWEGKLFLHCTLDLHHNRSYNEHDKLIRLDFLLNIVLFRV